MIGRANDLMQNYDIVSIIDLICNNISEYVYIADPESYEIIYVNQALKNLFNKKLVGGQCHSEFHGFNEPCPFCTNDVIQKKTGKPVKWEHPNSLLNKKFLIINQLMPWPDGRNMRLEIALEKTEAKKSELESKRRIAFVETVKRISSRFVGTNTVDDSVNESLEDLGRLSGASRSYLFCLNNSGKYISNTHEWCSEGVEPQIDNLQDMPVELYPWWKSMMQQGKAILFNDINQFPEEAAMEKTALEAQGIKSVLVLPVFAGTDLAGFIGFDNVADTREWSDEDLAHLRVAAEIIGNVLAREKAQQDLNKYKILAEKARDIMLFVNTSGQIIEANNAAVLTYGYSRNDILTMNLADLCMESKADLHSNKLQITSGKLLQTTHLRKDGSSFPVEVSTQGAFIGNETVLVHIIRDITERKRVEEQLHYLATHDFLTTIPNRYYLAEVLQDVITKATPQKTAALLFIDIDNFKVINDTFGHAEGDKTLISVVNRLKVSIRKSDFFARLGGDEFAMILYDVDLEAAKAIAEKLLVEIDSEELYVGTNKVRYTITLSIGIALIDGTISPEKLFAYADVALHNAKDQGKNRILVVQTTEEKARLAQTNSILLLLKQGIREDRFILHYQPVYRSDGKIAHYEALLRLIGNQGQIIYPGTFLPIAERFGLVASIDRWVVQTAIEILKHKHSRSIFVNISANSIGDEDLLNTIITSIKSSGIKADQLGFEITETAVIKDLSRAEHWIRTIKDIGCRFALDDFGAGFLSFTHLHLLPVDYLKIDGSFVKNLNTNPTNLALVQAMNAVAHALGKATIAEFVENDNIWTILKDLQVDCGQGYYLGKPKPHIK